MQILYTVCDRVAQRYLLAVLCMLGHTISVMDRQAFSMTMEWLVYERHEEEEEVLAGECEVDDVSDHATNDTRPPEEFIWSKQLQLYITSAMSVGMHLGMIPVGMITDRHGAKTLFGLSVFVPGICCLLTPVCARTSPYLMLFNRLVTGVFEAAQYPTVGWLAARWFPIRQQGTMLAIIFLGLPMGNSAGYFLVRFLQSWSSHFYVLAGMSVLWSYCWQATVFEEPFEHPYITLDELEMLVDKIPMYATDSELEPGWKYPWKHILTSKSLAILMVGHLGYTLFFNFTLFIIPDYFVNTHYYHFSYHYWLMFFVDLMMAFTILTSGFISDQLIHARWLNTTHVIKTFYSISTITGSLLLLGLVHAGCSTTSAILYYVATVLCLGFGQTNWSHACLHLAPNFVGICMGISSILSIFVMPVQLYVQNTFTVHDKVKEWKTVTYMNAAASILMAAIFLKWGNCQLRPWNQPQKKTALEVDYETDSLSGDRPAGVSSSRSQQGRDDEEFGVIELTSSMRFDKVKSGRATRPSAGATGAGVSPQEH